MSSFYSDASLVMIPSGYKTSKVYCAKPTDGAADLVFTRSNDTATRVGPDGLIEKVRTNLLLQSNSFDTTWTNLNTTETSGQAGYDGTNNAWLISATGGSAGIAQTISQSGMVTQSVYAKAGTSNWMMFRLTDGINNNLTYVDLTNRVFGNIGPNFVRGTITDVGGGWSRISVTINQASYNSFAFYVAFGNGNLSTTNETIFIQNAQLETGDIATDYIATTSAAVSVGPVANVPRLDYLGSSCPRLLLEPQTTALNQFSEQIDNAYWTKSNSTATANQTASPSGYVDAELILDNTSNAQHAISTSIAVTSGNKYTASFFLKAAGYTTAAIRMGVGALWTGGTGPTVEFDLVALTGTVVDGSGVTFDIEDYGNGWRRCSVTGTCVTSGNTAYSLYVKQYNAYIGSGTDGVYAWGANITATGYLQSYIPTLGAAVTRGADACVKSSATSIIGQTEGVVYFEWEYQNTGSSGGSIPISLDSGSGNEMYFWVQTNGNYLSEGFNGSVNQFSFSGSMGSFGTKKIAIAYKNNDFALYINGVLANTDTSGTVPTLNRLYVGRFYGNTNYNIASGIKQTLLFKTRLTNAQLAELTTL